MSTTEITPALTSPSDRSSKHRKAKAILAGGLVLGIGAAVTLAAWNDSEFIFGEFGGGHFQMLGSAAVNEAPANHDVADSGAQLSFQINAGNLTRSQTVAATYAVQLDAATDYAATVKVNSAAGSGDAESSLKYGIFTVDGWTDCTPAATAASTSGTQIVPAGTNLDSVANAVAFDLAKSSNGTDPGSPVYLCFQVTADSTLVQDKAAVATWELLAESKAS
ncbi:SipW-dependent-type signal peptide-containing protein [Arthrobacter globiformis]|uniref:SipW-dependent-type signal peptide-containing protein n=1 Tax=Arthrobacter globiformis TaxID=1665 RepID=UPI00277E91B5|nr:SipW-dependent-type signal peptide-containing protein [Arthrobacter globiformis]MDQ0866445.1 putative ribosomally synthesized peptide with SipW-like signal peptide [Arthrobacter globiformis]